MVTATKSVKPQSPDVATLGQLRALGFSDALVETPYRLVASLSGREKTGKTHFALTAPEPIIFFNVDLGTEGVVSKFQAQGKQVFIYDVRVPKTAKQDVYVPMWADLKVRIAKAYELKKGTVIWDTASEIYELARLARFGKLTQVLPHNYAEVNNEWRELLRTAYDAPLNTVFVHKMKAVWINNARTGNYELSGFAEMDYLSQVNLLCYREDSSEGGGMPEFSVFVKDSRLNPSVNGTTLRGPMCDFAFLLSLIHGK